MDDSEEEILPTLPAKGSVWQLSDFQHACRQYAQSGDLPFRIEIVEGDDEGDVVTSLIFRCIEPARPPCKWRIGVQRVSPDDNRTWAVNELCDQHTHWQSVFADPVFRQAAVEASFGGDAEEGNSPPRTPTPPLGLPPSVEKPLLWSPTASRTRTTSHSPLKASKRPFVLTQRSLPPVLSLAEWQQRRDNGPKAETSERPATSDCPPGSEQPMPERSDSALVSSHVIAADNVETNPLRILQPSAVLPNSIHIPLYVHKQKERDVVVQNDLDATEILLPEPSPRRQLLNAADVAPSAPEAPDTPFIVRPAVEIVVDESQRPMRPELAEGFPTIPAVGSRWPSRDAFKDACQAHAAASHPPFGFVTPASSTSGPVKYLCYACRHYRKGGHGCPYVLRLAAVDATSADTEWSVTNACYRHANHRNPSPPPRGSPGHRMSISGKRPSEGDLTASLAHLAATGPPRPKRVRAASPPLDRTLPLDVFLASLHPLLAGSAATSLRASGVDSAETLTSLTAHELTALLACASCEGLSALQRAVISNRIARHLDDAPNVGKRPGRKPRSIAGCLLALHAPMFPKEGDGAMVGKLIEDTGVMDADTLKSLEAPELVEILLSIDQLSDLQKIVLVNRVPML